MPDGRTLNFVAAVLCAVGGLASVVSGLVGSSSGMKDANARATVLSGLFATIGSVAWAASAYQDLVDARDDAAVDA